MGAAEKCQWEPTEGKGDSDSEDQRGVCLYVSACVPKCEYAELVQMVQKQCKSKVKGERGEKKKFF